MTARAPSTKGAFPQPVRRVVRGRVLGPIAQELWRAKNAPMEALYGWNAHRERYGILSAGARRVLRDAAQAIHGMELGPNEYWLPQIMSEAIEAAEALGL